MKGIVRIYFIAALIVASVIMTAVNAHAAAPCNPTSAVMCVAADDIATVYINSVYIGTFNYVNWDQNGVYPPCMPFPVTILVDSAYTTDNVVALSVKNTACCEIWGSWSIETQCAGGTHSCTSSDDPGMDLYNVPTPSDSPPPDDTNGRHWYEKQFLETVAPTAVCTWCPAVKDNGTIYGKLIYNPCTGALLKPLSYDDSGSGPIPGNYIYMRQPFAIITATPLPFPNFTITKTLVGPGSNITTNQRVTYNLHVCNTGRPVQGQVVVTDDYDDRFDYGGPYYGDCSGYGNGDPCYSGGGGFFYVKWLRGFPGNSCFDLTATVIDYYVDSSEWCQIRPNTSGVHFNSLEFVTPSVSATPVPDAFSGTVTVQMTCGGTSSITATITQTTSITPTFTSTSSNSPTATRTKISTLTQTTTNTISPTITLTWTVSNTHTPHPSGTETFTPTFTRTITNTFTPTFTRTMTWTNTATITMTGTATITTTWINAINLVKSESTQIAQIGDTVQYCIQFTNAGSNPANFTIWDTIPGPMEFLFCSAQSNGTDCNGPVTYPSGLCVEYAPTHNCRVISWNMTNVPAGATGQVCFWVLVARLQTYNPLMTHPEYFADMQDWLGKMLQAQNPGQRNIENLKNIRGPDRTD